MWPSDMVKKKGFGPSRRLRGLGATTWILPVTWLNSNPIEDNDDKSIFHQGGLDYYNWGSQSWSLMCTTSAKQTLSFAKDWRSSTSQNCFQKMPRKKTVSQPIQIWDIKNKFSSIIWDIGSQLHYTPPTAETSDSWSTSSAPVVPVSHFPVREKNLERRTPERTYSKKPSGWY